MFKVPPSKASTGDDKFEFEIDGKAYKIKKFGCLSLEQQIYLRSDECGEEETLDLIWGAKGTKAGDAVRALESDQFEDLKNAWIEESSVSPGESAASSS